MLQEVELPHAGARDHRFRGDAVLERDTRREFRTVGLHVAGAPSFALTSLDVR